MFKNVLVIIALSLTSGVALADDSIRTGNNAIIVNRVGGDVNMYLQMKEGTLKYEIEKIVDQIQARGDKKTKELVLKLRSLRKQLADISEEKSRLAMMVYIYQKELTTLYSSRQYEEGKQKDSPSLKVDINLIESSEESRIALVKELIDNTDQTRLIAILDVLVHDTESMSEDERKYWREILPAMTFQQKSRLLEILSLERRKLADLEKKYTKEIRDLNNKHLKEWLALQKADAIKKGDKKVANLFAIKEITLIAPTIQDLRNAENKLHILIKEYPDYLDAYIHLTEVLGKYTENRDYDAKSIMEKAEGRFVNSGEFYKELGYVYYRLGEQEKAYQLLKKAAMLIDNDAILHEKCARMAISRGDPHFAKTILDKSYPLNRTNPRFASTYSYALDESGNINRAITVLEEFKNNNAPSDIVFESLGWRYYKKEDYNKAFENFLDASRKNIENYNAYLMAALANIERGGRVHTSIKLAEEGLRSYLLHGEKDEKDMGEIHLALSILYSENGDNKKVVQYSPIAVKNTYGCSRSYMQEKRNWRSRSLLMLDKYRLNIGCP